MIKPQRCRVVVQNLSYLLTLGVVLLTICLTTFAQDCKSPSEESPTASIGANEVVQFSDVKTVRVLVGKVLDANDSPIENVIVDVFKVGKLTTTSEGGDLIYDKIPVKSYRVDRNGSFCIGNMPDGEYVLRFGTDVFAFKHTLIKVRKKRSGSRKPIEINLTPGT
jgi:hypothetical protein